MRWREDPVGPSLPGALGGDALLVGPLPDAGYVGMRMGCVLRELAASLVGGLVEVLACVEDNVRSTYVGFFNVLQHTQHTLPDDCTSRRVLFCCHSFCVAFISSVD